jgi:hypothetical protein
MGSSSDQVVDTNDSIPSLYKWAGGAPAFEKLSAIFYRHVLEEPLLKPLFENMPPEHSQRVAMWTEPSYEYIHTILANISSSTLFGCLTSC